SAAPVATPSNRHSTPRSSGAASMPATRCISDVPGLVKQVSTPPRTRVCRTASAPVNSLIVRYCTAGSVTVAPERAAADLTGIAHRERLAELDHAGVPARGHGPLAPPDELVAGDPSRRACGSRTP